MQRILIEPSRSGRVVYSAVLAVCRTDGCGFEPRTSTNSCGHVCRYVDRNGRWQSMQARDPPWLWNPGETLPEVQNRGISGPTKRTCVLQKLKKKNSYCPCLFFFKYKSHVANLHSGQWKPLFGRENWINQKREVSLIVDQHGKETGTEMSDLASCELIFGGHKSFSWSHWCPCFGLLVTSVLAELLT